LDLIGITHGFLNKQGAHIGDLPNVHVPREGSSSAEMLVAQASLSGGKTSLVDGEGDSPGS
jgi:Cu-Zn family superoxide dismutase